MTDAADSADFYTRLRRAGWSIGSAAFHAASGLVWVVTGSNGENVIRAEGATDTEAWWRACQKAASMLLGSTRCVSGLAPGHQDE
jgi:hypothetical protein